MHLNDKIHFIIITKARINAISAISAIIAISAKIAIRAINAISAINSNIIYCHKHCKCYSCYKLAYISYKH